MNYHNNTSSCTFDYIKLKLKIRKMLNLFDQRSIENFYPTLCNFDYKTLLSHCYNV